ncbi:MAG: dihydroneopterin aldolase [Acidimicrobiia bacterium]
MTDRIRISGIEVLARHGVLDSEKQNDQKFLIDLDLTLDLGAAAATDRLEDTVDYGELSQRTHDYVASNSFDLIERLAHGVADLAMEYPKVEAVEVTVHKPDAPIEVPFEDVSVTVSRER